MLAFSGGLDSTYLLKIVSEVLPKEKILAVTALSETYPREELLFSKRMARILGVRHRIIKTEELKNKNFISNPLNRCYFCKKELFGKLKEIAAKEKLGFVIDASNLSDNRDFRPGNLAKKELKVRSPLIEAGFTKDDIRRESKRLGLITWDKAPQACLASRIPYGTPISLSILKRIHKAEGFLRKLGLRQARVRHYNGLCRIEVPKKGIPLVLNKANLVVENLKRLGYNYITVDLEGYRSGSMNEVIRR